MRFILLVLLNVPIIILGLFNIITQYKLKKVTSNRLFQQVLLWVIILMILIASFPVYNLTSGKPILDSSELSLFDIVQTTAIIVIIYILNRQRQKLERNEKIIRDLHQELSIRLSEEKNDKS